MDLDELERLLREAQATPQELGGDIHAWNARQNSLNWTLRNHAEELIRDARRYRWLRGDCAADHSKRWMQWEVTCWQAPYWTPDLRRNELDDALDAAIAQEGKGCNTY